MVYLQDKIHKQDLQELRESQQVLEGQRVATKLGTLQQTYNLFALKK